MGWFQKAYWTLAGIGLVYVLGLLSLTIPTVQRNATYVHNVNPTYWQNLSDVEAYGFLKHQVQPFTITTPDDCSIHAWHILPIHLYKQHEKQLTSHPVPTTIPYHQALQRPNLRLLLADPDAIVILLFHGNAGHLASAYRPPMYQNLLALSTPSRPIHLLAFDYRGFGLSTCSPSEEGVTLDAITLLSHLTGHDMPTSVVDLTNPALQSLKTSTDVISPSQILLIGQSLGTFVATSTYHAWTAQLQRPPFKALMLIASFTSLPKLLESYSIKGLTPPLFSPIIGYPAAQRWFLSKIVDHWETARRLVELVRAPDIPLDLTIMHAKDDWEIPWREGRGNWDAVVEAVGVKEVYDLAVKEGRESMEYQEWDGGKGGEEGMGKSLKKVRWERVERGGHNRVTVGSQLQMAVLRVLDGE
jgi:pimeloyl-ACP methyl ester carboxylesterase